MVGSKAGGGAFDSFSHIRDHKVILCVCKWGHWGPTSYQENGTKETEAGDRKLEEEAAPIAPAQHCSYSNRRQGGEDSRETRGLAWS